MAGAFSTKEYYEGLLKDPIVRKNFKERHGYDLDTENVAMNASADKEAAEEFKKEFEQEKAR